MHRIRTIAAGAAVAVLLAACGDATSTGSVEGVTGAPSVPAQSQSAEPSAMASPSASAALNQLFPVFQAQPGSDLTGGAIISDVDTGASVILGIVAPSLVEATLPAVIIEGDCASQTGQGPTPPPGSIPSSSPAASPGAASPAASPGAASPGAASPAGSPAASASAGAATEFPLWLTPIAAGTSNSVIGVTTADLTAAPHAIIIEAGPSDPTIIACADLVEGPPQMSSPDAGASPPAPPDPGFSPEASPASS